MIGCPLELVPKEPAEGAPKRTLHPETLAAYRKVSLPTDTPQASGAQISATPRPTLCSQPPSTRELPVAELPLPALAKAKVLKPAQVESWQQSSFDLLTGCVARDVTDTIPGKIYEELFGAQEEHLPPAPRRRR